jgi:hypothetical protein
MRQHLPPMLVLLVYSPRFSCGSVPTPLVSESEEDMGLRLVDTAMPRRVTCSDRSHIHELLPRPDVVFPTNAGYG